MKSVFFRPKWSIADVASYPLVTYPKDPRASFARQTLSVCRKAGVKPVVADEAVEIHTAFGLVAAGLGICLAGQSVATRNRSDVVFIPIRDVKETTTLSAVTKIVEDCNLVEPFVNILAECISPQVMRARSLSSRQDTDR